MRACSAKEQEKQGFSIPAQLNFLKEYAATQGFKVAPEYVGVETVKATGAVAFGKMADYSRRTPRCGRF
jgi:hypothetical protein